MGIFNRKPNKDTKSQESISEIVLTTKEQESERITGKKDDWGDWEQHRVSATPFAIANFAYQSSAYKTKEGKPSTYAFLGSADSSARVHCVDNDGDWSKGQQYLVWQQKSPNPEKGGMEQ